MKLGPWWSWFTGWHKWLFAVSFMYIVKNRQESMCCLVVRSSYAGKRKNNNNNKRRTWLEKQPFSSANIGHKSELVNKVRNLFIVFLASHWITAELLYILASVAAQSIQLANPNKENGYWIAIAHLWKKFLLFVSMIAVKICSCYENMTHTLQVYFLLFFLFFF